MDVFLLYASPSPLQFPFPKYGWCTVPTLLLLIRLSDDLKKVASHWLIPTFLFQWQAFIYAEKKSNTVPCFKCTVSEIWSLKYKDNFTPIIIVGYTSFFIPRHLTLIVFFIAEVDFNDSSSEYSLANPEGDLWQSINGFLVLDAKGDM